jgi:hypothetical protein
MTDKVTAEALKRDFGDPLSLLLKQGPVKDKVGRGCHEGTSLKPFFDGLGNAGFIQTRRISRFVRPKEADTNRTGILGLR